MLPDFPFVKEKAYERLVQFFIQSAKQESGLLSLVPQIRIHEGDRWRIIGPGKNFHESEFSEQSSEMVLTHEEMDSLTEEELNLRIRETIGGLTSQIGKTLYEKVAKSTEESGNVVSTAGKPFTIEHFFQMIEKVEIDFDDNGVPYMPVFAPGSRKIKDELMAEFERTKNIPEYKERMDAIMTKKQEEWNVRESYRKLVD